MKGREEEEQQLWMIRAQRGKRKKSHALKQVPLQDMCSLQDMYLDLLTTVFFPTQGNIRIEASSPPAKKE
jgi:hypothetical protein